MYTYIPLENHDHRYFRASKAMVSLRAVLNSKQNILGTKETFTIMCLLLTFHRHHEKYEPPCGHAAPLSSSASCMDCKCGSLRGTQTAPPVGACLLPTFPSPCVLPGLQLAKYPSGRMTTSIRSQRGSQTQEVKLGHSLVARGRARLTAGPEPCVPCRHS